MNEAKNVNTKKADLIRDMVVVFLKFQIVFNAKFTFRNVLNMDISEQVLQYVSAISSKDVSEVGKQNKNKRLLKL
jgi:hypothetical protein